ncbi:hypothetical protein BJ986_001794 [Phycicoccus badiiscoriae]|uniref:SipW-cognate class signal peptide n=1 Tax=Pedococcus badiiscoriae TaxID=642776 RepID=A0A852WDF6_9MICO|nr:TasA family protein [Pedococcus badiiscoriae]NYG07307.1 hypothetical protein [Pedococcus badiiscoriae]
MKLNRKRAAAIATGAALTFIVGGVAFAYWSTSGTGTGSATTGTVNPVKINATGTAVSGLYPGAPARNVSGNFDNPNAGTVYVNQVTVAVAPGWSKQADGTKAACTAADFTITQPSATAHEIASGTGVDAWGPATIAMNNLPTNQDNCKNVTVDLVFSSN